MSRFQQWELDEQWYYLQLWTWKEIDGRKTDSDYSKSTTLLLAAVIGSTYPHWACNVACWIQKSH